MVAPLAAAGFHETSCGSFVRAGFNLISASAFVAGRPGPPPFSSMNSTPGQTCRAPAHGRLKAWPLLRTWSGSESGARGAAHQKLPMALQCPRRHHGRPRPATPQRLQATKSLANPWSRPGARALCPCRSEPCPCRHSRQRSSPKAPSKRLREICSWRAAPQALCDPIRSKLRSRVVGSPLVHESHIDRRFRPRCVVPLAGRKTRLAFRKARLRSLRSTFKKIGQHPPDGIEGLSLSPARRQICGPHYRTQQAPALIQDARSSSSAAINLLGRSHRASVRLVSRRRKRMRQLERHTSSVSLSVEERMANCDRHVG